MQHFQHLNPDLENVMPQKYEPSDFFNGMFADELSKIPAELHDRVAVYVHHHVEARVKDHLAGFRQEVEAELTSQKVDNVKNVEVMA